MRLSAALSVTCILASVLGWGCGGDATQDTVVPAVKGSFSGLYEWYGDNEVPLPAPSVDTYRRFVWKDLETAEGVYDFTAIDQALKEARARHRRFGFRVMACWSGEGAVVPAYLQDQMPNGFWFSSGTSEKDTYVPDWNSKAFLDRSKALLTALGRRYDGSATLAWVDIGLYGNWGEWHVSSFPYDSHPDAQPATLATKQELVDDHLAAFRKTRLLMMTDDPDALGYALRKADTVGMRRDSLGDRWFDEGLQASPETWALASERWKTAPFVTEFYAPSPSGMLETAARQVAQFHVTLVSNGNTSTKYVEMRPSEREAFAALQNLAGAYFVPSAASVSKDQGRLNVDCKIENKGNAPAYDAWTLRLGLRNSAGKMVATTDLDTDLRTLLPGDGAANLKGSIQLPDSLAKGAYQIVLLAKDPSGYLSNLPIGAKIDSATRGTVIATIEL